MNDRARPPSIRRRLLGLLLFVLACTWAATAALTYLHAHREIDALLDAHLEQAARLLVAQAGHEFEELELDEGDGANANYRTTVAFQVRRADGTLLFRSANAPAEPLAGMERGFGEAARGATRWRVYTAATGERDVVVHVAEDHATRERIARRVALSALVPQLVALPFLGLALWWVVGRSLQPLRRLADELASRRPNDLQTVARGPMPVELAGLAGRLDELLLRVRDSLDSERRFTSHAAHELRTPVAALRAQAEVAMNARDPAVRETALRHAVEACDRMSRLVTQLLLLARADETDRLESAAPCSLQAIARRVLADRAPAAIAEDTSVALDAGDDGTVVGDGALLEAAVRNLVDNAVQHGGSHGRVRVAMRTDGAQVRLTVEDAGPGVAPESLAQLGRRFYRGSNPLGSGSGLGLSIVKRIAELHGGTVAFERGAAGRGLRVELCIPAAGAPGHTERNG